MKTNERRQTSAIKKFFQIVISIIFIALQLFIYYLLFFGIKKYPLVLFFMELLAFICVVYIYNMQQNASYKLSWIVFIYVMPFFATMFYILFANGKSLPKKKAKKVYAHFQQNVEKTSCLQELQQKNEDAYRLCSLLHYGTQMPVYTNTKTTFFDDAASKTEQLLKDIHAAKHSIYLEYFIVSDGVLLEKLIACIQEKASQGVEVKIIYDAIGSKACLKRKTIKRINKIPNVQMVPYNPLGVNLNLSFNFRDHRKIAVIDEKIAYTGGDNLADEYVHLKQKYGYWRDNAMRFEGDAVRSFSLLFKQSWFMSTKEWLPHTASTQETMGENYKQTAYHMPFGDGPMNPENPAYKLIEALAGRAKKYLYISTPYLIIDNEFLNKIATAAKSGVDVKVLVPHIPDKKMVFKMTQSNYGILLKAGVKIYEYTPGFNHAKNVICDDMYGLVGTINLDYRSLLLHFECADFMVNDENIIAMREDFEKAIAQSQEVDIRTWKKRPLLRKVWEKLLNLISPLL